ncbi:MAG: succinate dehydrogenase, hydrophobic membrane anchor protein [gamma proteobacterium symbiont of Ctena orbiculata]|uniref:Succinate dehydrogenase hydrophobic membrane anchor subunit n=1 Tax=Candidatus Thiodiazotropha taylori TaxID=2792791 RepID=A0A944QT02_9GAMM|nr:succinate dehydrogenase, hydrophobic membrane anchor protein [Candidatus Thiodiazotropha taylori]PUB88146.1 MAG: succinate dehydrogenase, hydrophobic membrane anchor protein [gamma proteobacterium symbiont of Ctena orbiculata]MBT2989448.1 succinate dehydrogenase, hydrophobic membrane anchor protein [Candidatus Thiodiazotropha taylori]MBT2997028.1 succinate dehydrogenase, hydrophobic membrane anchor protein [Candidatus Thiodiazotropha taylori]MBT3000883.1 succinate dehydrogenase, hydrophobic 
MSRRASGLRAWFLQRATAIYLLLFIIFMLQQMILNPPQDFAAWQGWVAQPLIGLGLILFFASLLLHAWVGFRDVLIDYVHPTAIRVTLLTLAGFILLGCAFWVVKIIFTAATA